MINIYKAPVAPEDVRAIDGIPLGTLQPRYSDWCSVSNDMSAVTALLSVVSMLWRVDNLAAARPLAATPSTAGSLLMGGTA